MVHYTLTDVGTFLFYTWTLLQEKKKIESKGFSRDIRPAILDRAATAVTSLLLPEFLDGHVLLTVFLHHLLRREFYNSYQERGRVLLKQGGMSD